MQTEKQWQKQNIQELWENYKRCSIHMVGIPEREGAYNRVKEITEVKMDTFFLKLIIDHASRKLRNYQAG